MRAPVPRRNDAGGPEGAAIHLALTTLNAFLAMIAFEPPQQGLIKVDGTFA
jgi:hypothetical protein